MKRLTVCVLILLGSISVCVSQEQDRLLKTVSLDTKISVAAFSANGQLVATADRTNTTSGKSAITVWEVESGHFRFTTDDYPVYALTFNSDASLLAVAGNDGVRLFRTADGRLIRTFSGNQLFAVAFDSTDKTLAAGSAEGEVRMWHVTGTTLLHTFALNKQVTSVAFSPDGRLLAAGTASAPQGKNPIVIWRLSDRTESTSLGGHDFGVLSLAFDSKGQNLISSGSDGRAVMWRLRNGGSVNLAPASSKGPIHAVKLSPDDQWIAFDADNEISLFKPKTRQQLTLKGHTKPIVQLHFSQDGKTLLSASEDNTIRVWRVE